MILSVLIDLSTELYTFFISFSVQRSCRPLTYFFRHLGCYHSSTVSSVYAKFFKYRKKTTKRQMHLHADHQLHVRNTDVFEDKPSQPNCASLTEILSCLNTTPFFLLQLCFVFCNFIVYYLFYYAYCFQKVLSLNAPLTFLMQILFLYFCFCLVSVVYLLNCKVRIKIIGVGGHSTAINT